VLELVHAVKFRSSIPDTNLQSVLQVHNRAFEQFSTYIHAFATSFLFSRSYYWLDVFPRLPLLTCFPALATGYNFSRAWHWFQVWHTRFPVLGTGYKFFQACHWSFVSPDFFKTRVSVKICNWIYCDSYLKSALFAL